MPADSLELVVITFVGWPAIITSLILALCGLLFKRWILLVIGGIVALPFSTFYMGGYFHSYFIGSLLALGHFASAFSIYKKKLVVARAWMLPFTVLVILVAYAVLTQAH